MFEASLSKSEAAKQLSETLSINKIKNRTMAQWWSAPEFSAQYLKICSSVVK